MLDLFTLLGLEFSIWRSVILVKHLFITNEEIDELSKLPLEPASGNLTGRVSGKNVAILGSDIEQIEQYREHFIQHRKMERTNGKRGLCLLLFGFVLQAIPPIVEMTNNYML